MEKKKEKVKNPTELREKLRDLAGELERLQKEVAALEVSLPDQPSIEESKSDVAEVAESQYEPNPEKIAAFGRAGDTPNSLFDFPHIENAPPGEERVLPKPTEVSSTEEAAKNVTPEPSREQVSSTSTDLPHLENSSEVPEEILLKKTFINLLLARVFGIEGSHFLAPKIEEIQFFLSKHPGTYNPSILPKQSMEEILSSFEKTGAEGEIPDYVNTLQEIASQSPEKITLLRMLLEEHLENPGYELKLSDVQKTNINLLRDYLKELDPQADKNPGIEQNTSTQSTEVEQVTEKESVGEGNRVSIRTEGAEKEVPQDEEEKKDIGSQNAGGIKGLQKPPGVIETETGSRNEPAVRGSSTYEKVTSEYKDPNYEGITKVPDTPEEARVVLAKFENSVKGKGQLTKINELFLASLSDKPITQDPIHKEIMKRTHLNVNEYAAALLRLRKKLTSEYNVPSHLTELSGSLNEFEILQNAVKIHLEKVGGDLDTSLTETNVLETIKKALDIDKTTSPSNNLSAAAVARPATPRDVEAMKQRLATLENNMASAATQQQAPQVTASVQQGASNSQVQSTNPGQFAANRSPQPPASQRTPGVVTPPKKPGFIERFLG